MAIGKYRTFKKNSTWQAKLYINNKGEIDIKQEAF